MIKWLGNHVVDFIARFKSDVYLEDISTGTIVSGGNLGLDSNNKIVKAVDGGGDITSVVAGTNLSGGATSGAATVNLADASTSVKGAASFSSDNFAASSGAITIKDGGVDLTAEVTGVLPSANMDEDTAHLSGIQTFTGTKSFETFTSFLGTVGSKILVDGNSSVTPGDGAAIHVDEFNVTDNSTSASGTAARYTHVTIEPPRLMATNSSVTTTDAATLYIKGGPVASTNQTITKAWALWVDNGNIRFDGNVDVDGTLETDALTIGGAAVLAQATESEVGAVELATTAEADTGTDTARAVTPAGLKSHVDANARKCILRSGAFYINDSPMIQNSLYFGHSLGSSDSNWNDPQAAGGAISSTNSFTIAEDDMNWGYILPFDVSAVEVQCSLRPAGGSGVTGDDFSLAIYTANRSDSSNTVITLTKVAHQADAFNNGNYATNDLTYTGDLVKGTMIFVGVGTETSGTPAKNARGIMNITITQR